MTTGGSSEVCDPSDPRVRRTRLLVHEATIETLVEQGFEGFSIEAVAQRAGVARTTIYRNWRSRAELVVDAFGSLSAPPDIEPSGDLRADLMVIVGHMAEELPRARWASVIAALVAAAEHDVELAREKRKLINTRQQPLVDAIEAAIKAGQIRADIDPLMVVSMLAGPLFYRRLMSGETVDHDFAGQVVDCVLAGLGYEPDPDQDQ